MRILYDSLRIFGVAHLLVNSWLNLHVRVTSRFDSAPPPRKSVSLRERERERARAKERERNQTHVLRHDSSMWDVTYLCKTWLICMCRDSFICGVTHSYATWLARDRHVSDCKVTCETWLIYVRRDSFVCVVTHLYVSWLIHMRRDSREILWGVTFVTNSLSFLKESQIPFAFWKSHKFLVLSQRVTNSPFSTSHKFRS